MTALYHQGDKWDYLGEVSMGIIWGLPPEELLAHPALPLGFAGSHQHPWKVVGES